MPPPSFALLSLLFPHKDLLGDVLQRRGYSALLAGKSDWTTGGHSLNVRLNSWTMYVIRLYSFLPSYPPSLFPYFPSFPPSFLPSFRPLRPPPSHPIAPFLLSFHPSLLPSFPPSFPHSFHHSFPPPFLPSFPPAAIRYTQFPYDTNTSGGWYDETMCPDDGSIGNSHEYYRHPDWKKVGEKVNYMDYIK